MKDEQRKDSKNKIREYNLQLHAHNESGSDTWIILKNLPPNKRIGNNIETAKV